MINESCLEVRPDNCHIILSHQPGYMPKVPTTPFRDQVVKLQVLPLEEADPALTLLCPVHPLRLYFRTSGGFFVCYGGQQKGKVFSKQRFAHWIVDTIVLANQAWCLSHLLCLPSLEGIRVLSSFTGEFPSWQTLLGVPSAPLAVRRGGAPDGRSSTCVYAQASPGARLGAYLLQFPLRVIPQLYSSTVLLPSTTGTFHKMHCPVGQSIYVIST